MANKYFFFFVCHDAHQPRENICYLVIIIGFNSNDSKRQTNCFFSFVCFIPKFKCWLPAEKYRSSPAERKYLLLSNHYGIQLKRFQTTNEYFFSFVCHDAPKQRENICYLVIIIGFDSNDSKRQTNIFSLLSAMTLTGRDKISVT